MKKILCAFFAIVLVITSSYCDDESQLIDADAFYPTILDSVVRIEAIRKVLKEYSLSGNYSYSSLNFLDDFTNSLHKKARNGKITIKIVYDSFDKATKGMFDHSTTTTLKFVQRVISEHNIVVLSSKHENGLLTEDDFLRIVHYASDCPDSVFSYNKRSVDFDDYSCQEKCREVSAEHICRITHYSFYSNNTVFGRDTICKCNPRYIIEGQGESRTYRDMPKWEDYKKLYNIK